MGTHKAVDVIFSNLHSNITIEYNLLVIPDTIVNHANPKLYACLDTSAPESHKRLLLKHFRHFPVVSVSSVFAI